MNSEIKKTVKVHADAAGNVVVVSKNNSEYGHIHVSQIRMVTDEETGFARKKEVHALIPGKISDLKGYGWVAGEMVEGKVYIREQKKPFNPKDPERDFKIAGETGICCTEGGSPIYRKHFYTENLSISDSSLAHDNTEEIKAAYARIKAEKEAAEETSGAGVGQL